MACRLKRFKHALRQGVPCCKHVIRLTFFSILAILKAFGGFSDTVLMVGSVVTTNKKPNPTRSPTLFKLSRITAIFYRSLCIEVLMNIAKRVVLAVLLSASSLTFANQIEGVSGKLSFVGMGNNDVAVSEVKPRRRAVSPN